jgi:hypothetical protein
MPLPTSARNFRVPFVHLLPPLLSRHLISYCCTDSFHYIERIAIAYICRHATPAQVEALQTIEQQEAEIKRLRQQLATSRAPPVAASTSDAVMKLSTPRSSLLWTVATLMITHRNTAY